MIQSRSGVARGFAAALTLLALVGCSDRKSAFADACEKTGQTHKDCACTANRFAQNLTDEQLEHVTELVKEAVPNVSAAFFSKGMEDRLVDRFSTDIGKHMYFWRVFEDAKLYCGGEKS